MTSQPMDSASSTQKTGNEEERDWYDDEYHVEKVLSRRTQRGKRQYLIKWRGFPDSENSWEPEENLYCEDRIAEFEKCCIEQQLANSKKRKTGESPAKVSPASPKTRDLIYDAKITTATVQRKPDSKAQTISTQKVMQPSPARANAAVDISKQFDNTVAEKTERARILNTMYDGEPTNYETTFHEMNDSDANLSNYGDLDNDGDEHCGDDWNEEYILDDGAKELVSDDDDYMPVSYKGKNMIQNKSSQDLPQQKQSKVTEAQWKKTVPKKTSKQIFKLNAESILSHSHTNDSKSKQTSQKPEREPIKTEECDNNRCDRHDSKDYVSKSDKSMLNVGEKKHDCTDQYYLSDCKDENLLPSKHKNASATMLDIHKENCKWSSISKNERKRKDTLDETFGSVLLYPNDKDSSCVTKEKVSDTSDMQTENHCCWEQSTKRTDQASCNMHMEGSKCKGVKAKHICKCGDTGHIESKEFVKGSAAFGCSKCEKKINNSSDLDLQNQAHSRDEQMLKHKQVLKQKRTSNVTCALSDDDNSACSESSSVCSEEQEAEALYQCGACDKLFSVEEQLDVHLLTHVSSSKPQHMHHCSRQAKPKPPNLSSTEKVMICSFCKEKFNDEQHLSLHIQTCEATERITKLGEVDEQLCDDYAQLVNRSRVKLPLHGSDLKNEYQNISEYEVMTGKRKAGFLNEGTPFKKKEKKEAVHVSAYDTGTKSDVKHCLRCTKDGLHDNYDRKSECNIDNSDERSSRARHCVDDNRSIAGENEGKQAKENILISSCIAAGDNTSYEAASKHMSCYDSGNGTKDMKVEPGISDLGVHKIDAMQ